MDDFIFYRTGMTTYLGILNSYVDNPGFPDFVEVEL